MAILTSKRCISYDHVVVSMHVRPSEWLRGASLDLYGVGADRPQDKHVPASPGRWLPQAGGLAGLSDCCSPPVRLSKARKSHMALSEKGCSRQGHSCGIGVVVSLRTLHGGLWGRHKARWKVSPVTA